MATRQVDLLPDDLAGGFGEALDNLLGPVGASRPDPFGGATFGRASDPFAGAAVGRAQPFQGVTYGRTDPFGAAFGATGDTTGQGGGSALSRLFDGIGGLVRNPFARAFTPVPKAATGIGTGAAAVGAVAGGATAGTPGAGWGAPSTAQLDAELAGSPLEGQGATIAAIAQRHGVPVTVAMGILRQESSYGRNARGNNYGGLMNADGSHTLAQFGTVGDGLEAVIGNMGSQLYRGKTISQFMNTYAPPDDGNDTNGYINNILALDHQWGGQSDWNTVVTGGPQPGPRPQAAGGAYAFPVVGYQGSVALHHGASGNASDIMAPAGTGIVAMRGGRVIDAGYNALGGNTVTILGDDGLTYYYAHMQQPALVQAGAQLQAGAALGYVGNTGNAINTPSHLHLGIGRGIQSGAGPEGGAGNPWGQGPQENAVGLLTWVLNGGQ